MQFPKPILRVINFISQAFYNDEEHIVLRYLIFYPCISETDLATILKLERKQLRKTLNKLRAEKFLRQKQRVECDSEGKSVRTTYFYINVITFINVVRYKLDVMQKRIDSKAKESMTRSSYNCSDCKKAFQDLDIDLIYDHSTCSLICDFCGGNVIEDESILTNRNSRNVLIMFNEELKTLFEYLAQVEKIEIPHELIDPQPLALSAIMQNWKTLPGEQSINEAMTELKTEIKIILDDDLFDSLYESVQPEQPSWFSHPEGICTAVSTNHEKETKSDFESLIEDLKKKRILEDEVVQYMMLVKSYDKENVFEPGSGLRPCQLSEEETFELLGRRHLLTVGGVKTTFYHAMKNIDKMSREEISSYIELSGFLFDDSVK